MVQPLTAVGIICAKGENNREGKKMKRSMVVKRVELFMTFALCVALGGYCAEGNAALSSHENHREADARRAQQRFGEYKVTVAGLTWTYKINEDSVIISECSQSGGISEPVGMVTIPSALDGKPVTIIGKGVFSWCINLSGITIPESVMIIGEKAFSGSGLTSVTIPNSVTNIAKEAFSSCDALTSVKIPNSVITIGEGAFSSCDGLVSITIPESVTTIGKNAFRGSSLTRVTIPNSVTMIADGAFSCCESLASVTIPTGVTHIGEEAFSGCLSLTSIKIPNSVTSIGKGAFTGCRRLSDVTIPYGVTHIGDDAFLGCGLTSVTLPTSVTSLGMYAFDRNTMIIRETENGSTSDTDSSLENHWNLWIVIVSSVLIVIGLFLGFRKGMLLKGMLRQNRSGMASSVTKKNETELNQSASISPTNQEEGDGGVPKLNQSYFSGVSATKVGPYEEHPNWRSWRGRMSGSEYLIFTCISFPLIALGTVLGALGISWLITLIGTGEAFKSAGNALLVVAILWLVIVRFSASVRRFHDLGLPGWWVMVFYLGELVCACGMLTILITRNGNWTLDGTFMVIKDSWFWFGLLGLLEVVVFVFLPGTCGPNKFGPDPKGRLNSQTGDLASLAHTTKKLKELGKMKDSGLISESEYEEKRAQILSGG